MFEGSDGSHFCPSDDILQSTEMELELEEQPKATKKPRPKKKAEKPLTLAEMRRGRGGHLKAPLPVHARPLRFAANREPCQDSDENVDIEEASEGFRGRTEDSDDEERLLGELFVSPVARVCFELTACTWQNQAAAPEGRINLPTALRSACDRIAFASALC